MSKKAKYAKAAVKSFFSKNNWKNAVKTQPESWGGAITKTLVDLGAGFAGAAGGAFLSWGALPIGLAGNIAANKFGQSWARSMTVAMMTASVDETIGASRKAANTGFDFKAELDEGKQRMSGYFTQVYRKFGLNKLFGEKQPAAEQTSTSVNGLGNASLDMLDEFNQQIFSSGIENQQQEVAPQRVNQPAPVEMPEAYEAFSVNGLDDLNTAHII